MLMTTTLLFFCSTAQQLSKACLVIGQGYADQIFGLPILMSEFVVYYNTSTLKVSAYSTFWSWLALANMYIWSGELFEVVGCLCAYSEWEIEFWKFEHAVQVVGGVHIICMFWLLTSRVVRERNILSFYIDLWSANQLFFGYSSFSCLVWLYYQFLRSGWTNFFISKFL